MTQPLEWLRRCAQTCNGGTHERLSSTQHRPDSQKPPLRRQNPACRALPSARRERQGTLPHAWWRKKVWRAHGTSNALRHELYAAEIKAVKLFMRETIKRGMVVLV